MQTNHRKVKTSTVLRVGPDVELDRQSLFRIIVGGRDGSETGSKMVPALGFDFHELFLPDAWNNGKMLDRKEASSR